MTNSRVPSPAAGLSLVEKASLTSGASMFYTKPLPGIPAIMLSDGPNGVRKQVDALDHLGLAGSLPATCFPPAVALGSTWDTGLVERVGVALGEECRAMGVNVLLGPGINIKRSPLGGRNFEYFSEDPLVSGVLGSAYVRGLQSQRVGASLKHFAANSQEHDRLRVSSDVDERTLREIYLRGFQRVIEDEQPWTVMCSYNRINGAYASEDPWLLTTVLRDEWKFEGLVVSDWGAVNDRVRGIAAGMDLEMPGSNGVRDAEIVDAVFTGGLDEAVVDRAADRIIDLVQKTRSSDSGVANYEPEEHHALAREVASCAIVLLKNEPEILPLQPGRTIGVIGEFARTPRFQGVGSSHVVPTAIDSALGPIREAAGDTEVIFAPGFAIAGATDPVGLAGEAIAVASAVDVVVVFLGLPEAEESEGFDRVHMNLPSEQTDLLDAILEVNSEVVVVLSNGGVLNLSPFADRVPAIVEGWLLGQAGGGAIADVLFGAVNPSGHLTETIPVRLEDTPAFLSFPGENGHVRYGEGLYVGYRCYDARRMDVLFPFGHGLSYTTFTYSDLTLRADESGIEATVTVTNSGHRPGRAVPQLYVSFGGSRVERAPRELKAFSSIHLEPGESVDAVLTIERRDLAYWDTGARAWIVEDGTYSIEIGASSRDIRVRDHVQVVGDVLRAPLSVNSTLGELVDNPLTGPFILRHLAHMTGATSEDGHDPDPYVLDSMRQCPINRFVSFAGPTWDPALVREQIDIANQAR